MNKQGFLSRNWAYLFVAIPVALQLIFFFYPLINGVFYSLTDWTGLTRNFNVIGLENYVKIFQDQAFYKSLGFTILFTIGLVVGKLSSASGLPAFSIARFGQSASFGPGISSQPFSQPSPSV